MANHMAEVAKMLGVELDEEFECDDNYRLTYYFDDNSLKCNGFPAAESLMMLLNETLAIKHKPWRPKDEELFYHIVPGGGVRYDTFCPDYFNDMNLYKLGNCYRTREEAESNRDKWVAFYASNEVLEV